MKKTRTYLTASLFLVLLTATACSTDKPAAAPGNTTTTNTTVSSSNETTNETANANSTSTGNSTSISLTPFQQSESSGIHVTIPAGWNETPIHGGDYMGWQLTNPSDSNQQIKIISSGCVGCTTTASGSVDAKQVIPEKNAQITSTSDNHYIVNYTFPTENTANIGAGLVSVSHDSSGYGSIEVVMPASEQTVAKQIIESFQLTR